MTARLPLAVLALALPVAAAVPRPPDAEADWEKAVRRQAEAVRGAAGPDRLAAALAAEADLFPGPTHARLWLLDRANSAHRAAKDVPAAERAAADAVALQAGFFGPRPAAGFGAAPAGRLRRAADIRADVLGDRHPLVGLTLTDLALALEDDGRTAAARDTLTDVAGRKPEPGASTSFVSAYAPDAQYHLDRLRLSDPAAAAAPGGPGAKRVEEAERLAAEADRLAAAGDVPGAGAAWGKSLPGYGSRHADAVGEADQLDLARRHGRVVERFVGFVVRHGKSREEAAAAAYAHVVYSKGAVYTAQHRYRIERRHPLLKPAFDAHEELTRRLAFLAPTAPAGDPEVRRLLARKAALEAEMARRYEAMPKQLHAPPAQYLPPGTALVDYYAYAATTPDGKEDRGLACFVSRPFATHRGKEVVVRDLGRLAPVADAVARWRAELVGRGGGSGSEAAAEVRRRVWDPVAPLLDGAGVVLVCPDATLAAAPFAALPGAKPGAYLVEEVGVAVAPVPQLIARLPSTTDRVGPPGLVLPRPDRVDAPLLVGGVDFAARPPAPRPGDRPRFDPLPGAAKEVAEIDALFRKVAPGKPPAVLTGAGATEAAVRKAAGGYRWLHVATHGYFAPAGGAGPDLPDLRSAVALAGANHGGTGPDDDGLLTALEVASLDLGPVEMVVLSACETGLGKALDGEGVLGLQRAFQVAGARAAVTTLWQVPDHPTQALMTRFYGNLWDKKMPPLDALREAQRWMLAGGGKAADGARGAVVRDGSAAVALAVGAADPVAAAAAVAGPGGSGARGMTFRAPPGAAADGRAPPYYWAGFVLSGDWR